MIRKEAIVAILGSPVAYYAAFAKVLGGVEAGIFASQFFYWYGKGHDPQGWVYKTQSAIEDETGLTRRNQETARKKLRKLGVLEEKHAGMPAKLYYRLNLDVLFPLMNAWFAVEVLGVDEEDAETAATVAAEEAPTGVHPQDGATSQPRMSKSANQGSTDTPSKDVQMRQSSMADSDNHISANPPRMHGAMRRANTKTTTKTTSENTTETTTTTDAQTAEPNLSDAGAEPVDVGVDVSGIPDWLVDEFRFFLGDDRVVNDADLVSLRALVQYPEHIVLQAFDAAQAWLHNPDKEPIHSLGRWLLGAAKRKMEDEEQRGNSVSHSPNADDDLAAGLVAASVHGRLESEEDELPAPLSEEELFWQSVLAELELRLPRDTFDNWVRDMQLLASDDDEYVIGLPDARSKDWVENRFANTLRQTLSSRLGRATTVRFEVLDE